jgi:hypothetical protein
LLCSVTVRAGPLLRGSAPPTPLQPRWPAARARPRALALRIGVLKAHRVACQVLASTVHRPSFTSRPALALTCRPVPKPMTPVAVSASSGVASRLMTAVVLGTAPPSCAPGLAAPARAARDAVMCCLVLWRGVLSAMPVRSVAAPPGPDPRRPPAHRLCASTALHRTRHLLHAAACHAMCTCTGCTDFEPSGPYGPTRRGL